MDKRIILLLAALAGITAFVLFFPSDDDIIDPALRVTAEDRVAVALADQIVEPPKPATPAQAFREQRRSSPFYKHAKAVAPPWQQLGNVLVANGMEGEAEEARAVAKALRNGIRPDAIEDDREAALVEEVALFERLTAMELPPPVVEVLTVIRERTAEVVEESAASSDAPPEPAE